MDDVDAIEAAAVLAGRLNADVGAPRSLRGAALLLRLRAVLDFETEE